MKFPVVLDAGSLELVSLQANTLREEAQAEIHKPSQSRSGIRAGDTMGPASFPGIQGATAQRSSIYKDPSHAVSDAIHKMLFDDVPCVRFGGRAQIQWPGSYLSYEEK